MAKKSGKTPEKKLMFEAIRKFALGILLLGVFLFVCAGTLSYWNAWLYLGALSMAIFSFGAYLFAHDKELLKKRLNSKEKEPEQKTYVRITSLCFLATFVVCGLDFRFGWSHMPSAVAVIGLIKMLAGFGLFVIVLMQNRFASKTIEIQAAQRVIDTGVYSVIRHPMYTAALLMFFASPFALGSYYAAIPMVFYLVGIVLRIKNEEKVLAEGLEGYTGYMRNVKYRLIPFVW